MKKTIKDSDITNHKKTPHFEGLFVALFLILAALIFMNSGIFMVKEVSVQGNQTIPTEDILLTARLSHYKNIFQVDVAKIQQDILKNPKISGVEVTRIFPYKVLIIIKERQPLCLLLYRDNLLVIGDDSVVMEIKDESDPINLPIVTGVKSNRMIVGDKVQNSQFIVAMEILKYADENLRQIISEINLTNFQLYLDLPNSHNTLKVELGTDSDIEKKIYNLRAILSQTAPDELAKVDLRTPDLPTEIKLKKTRQK
jgi:cell division septal protein FtsQ